MLGPDAPPPATPVEAVAAFLAGCRLRAPLDLPTPGARVYPVDAPWAAPRDHVLLADHMGRGVEIAELGGGTVPTLRLDNRLAQKVLGLEGELLIGCKQNRVLNTTVLVDAHATTDIPVSCVEQSRWHHRSATMRSSEAMAPRELKRSLKRSVGRSATMGGTHDSDQGGVWATVATLSSTLGVHSATSDLDAVLDGRRRRGDTLRLEELLDAGLTGASGYALELDGRLVALEVLGDRDDFARLRRRMIRSLATDLAAHDGPDRAGPPPEEAPLERLARAVRHLGTESPAVGLGQEVRVASRRTSVAVSALVEGGRTHVVSALA